MPLALARCSLCAKPGWQVEQGEDAIPHCGWRAVEDGQQAREWGRALARALFPRTAEKPKPRPRLRRSGTESPYEKLKRENRVEDVAGRLTDMRGTGKTLKGRCPFHIERTPSFIVWPASQRWRCFGACAQGGDLIDLLKKAGEL
jgi:hypothetical protein